MSPDGENGSWKKISRICQTRKRKKKAKDPDRKLDAVRRLSPLSYCTFPKFFAAVRRLSLFLSLVLQSSIFVFSLQSDGFLGIYFLASTARLNEEVGLFLLAHPC